jgi:hypothetical protein
LIPGTQIAALPLMGGWVMLVIPPENQIIIQTQMGVYEPLMWILAWIHPKGSRYIWLTKSEYVAKPINAYLT